MVYKNCISKISSQLSIECLIHSFIPIRLYTDYVQFRQSVFESSFYYFIFSFDFVFYFYQNTKLFGNRIYTIRDKFGGCMISGEDKSFILCKYKIRVFYYEEENEEEDEKIEQVLRFIILSFYHHVSSTDCAVHTAF